MERFYGDYIPDNRHKQFFTVDKNTHYRNIYEKTELNFKLTPAMLDGYFHAPRPAVGIAPLLY